MPRKGQGSGNKADPHRERWEAYWLLRRQVAQLAEADRDEAERSRLVQKRTEARNRLIEAYLPLLKACAHRLKSRLPNTVELGDLYNAGVFGLANAIKGYDPARGVRFTTFAPLRISGSMVDHMRTVDRVPRLVRERARKLQQATLDFSKEHGRPPTDDELAAGLGVPPREVKRIRDDGHVVGEVSLDQPVSNRSQDTETGMASLLGDPDAVSPLDAAHRRSLKALFCRMLNRQEHLILVLYYYEGMTMKEIGLTLDLSESRVSQMHTLIRERLRVQLEGREDVLSA